MSAVLALEFPAKVAWFSWTIIRSDCLRYRHGTTRGLLCVSCYASTWRPRRRVAL